MGKPPGFQMDSGRAVVAVSAAGAGIGRKSLQFEIRFRIARSNRSSRQPTGTPAGILDAAGTLTLVDLPARSIVRHAFYAERTTRNTVEDHLAVFRAEEILAVPTKVAKVALVHHQQAGFQIRHHTHSRNRFVQTFVTPARHRLDGKPVAGVAQHGNILRVLIFMEIDRIVVFFRYSVAIGIVALENQSGLFIGCGSRRSGRLPRLGPALEQVDLALDTVRIRREDVGQFITVGLPLDLAGVGRGVLRGAGIAVRNIARSRVPLRSHGSATVVMHHMDGRQLEVARNRTARRMRVVHHVHLGQHTGKRGVVRRVVDAACGHAHLAVHRDSPVAARRGVPFTIVDHDQGCEEIYFTCPDVTTAARRRQGAQRPRNLLRGVGDDGRRDAARMVDILNGKPPVARAGPCREGRAGNTMVLDQRVGAVLEDHHVDLTNFLLFGRVQGPGRRGFHTRYGNSERRRGAAARSQVMDHGLFHATVQSYCQQQEYHYHDAGRSPFQRKYRQMPFIF
ncbi:Uncharacterised protein [Alistipes sp. cv1]|nr:Uncharacterised protein [Faecalibacterium prausnitzii]